MTHVFTKGEYTTRDGRKAVVLCDDAPGSWPLVGYVTALGVNSAPASWRPTGEHDGPPRQNPSDLMPPKPAEPEQVVRWMYLWNNGQVTFQEGDVGPLMAGFNSGGIIMTARTRVVLTPGKFDDENTPDPYTQGWNEALTAALHSFGDENTRHDNSFWVKARALRRQP